MQLVITGFCIKEGSLGIGFQQANIAKQYWNNIPGTIKDTSFINMCNFGYRGVIEALEKRQIPYTCVDLYVVIDEEEVRKYITHSLYNL